MKRFAYFAAAALAVGTFGLTGCKDDTAKTGDNKAPGQTPATTPGQKIGETVGKGVDKTTQAANQAGKTATQAAQGAKENIAAVVTPSGTSDPKGIRNTVEGVITNALDENNFNDMTQAFVEADQKRIDASKPDTKDLDAAIAQFRKSWSDKYGGDAFKVMSADEVYNEQFLKIETTGTANSMTGTATIAAGRGLPEVKLPVVGQGGQWKIDVDDSLDGKEVHSRLMKAIGDLQKDAAGWPADKAEAYRVVTHKLLAALLGK